MKAGGVLFTPMGGMWFAEIGNDSVTENDNLILSP